MALTTTLPRSVGEIACLPQSDYIEGLALAAANTAERIAIPAGAVFVLFSATANYAAKIGGSSVTAAMPTDTTDGTTSMLNPTFRRIPTNATHISVVSATAGCLVSMEFFAAIGG
jgi:hypothetical protein